MRARGWRRGALVGLVIVVALVAAGCGGGDDGGSSGAQGGGDTPQLQGLITPGTLTVGTELPAPPFWVGKDYDSLTGGFEVDLSKEIGKRLGLNMVKYVEMPFSSLVAGQQCPCDISLADGKNLKWGAQLNTTGASYITDTIQPTTEAQVFDHTVDAFQALNAGQIDAVLLDTPIVLGAVENRHARDAEVVGQFRTGEVYAAVLNRGWPNLEAFNTVIRRLKSEGYVDQLFHKYFAEQAAVNVIDN